jgi:hypothetical protein
MPKKTQKRKYLFELEERIKYLEETNRWTLDALDMVVSLGDFKNSINPPDQEPAVIFSAARTHLKRLMPFQVLALFMIDETNSDFVLVDCEPETYDRKRGGLSDFRKGFFLGIVSKPGSYGSGKIFQSYSSISSISNTIAGNRDDGRNSCK